jgi:hypothetical protein
MFLKDPSLFLSGAEEYNVDEDEDEGAKEDDGDESDESLSQVYDRKQMQQAPASHNKRDTDSKIYI